MKTLAAIVTAAAVVAAYLLLWPTGMDPVAWTPSPTPALEGRYAYNEKLKGIQRLAEGAGIGPEGINVSAAGQVYAGFKDGRVISLAANGASWFEMANTGGRPLGITFGPDGGLVIADAKKGLLHLGRGITPLVSEAGGVPFGFTDDADNTRYDKNIYFTDASAKFGADDYVKAFLEHSADGRLLEYNVASKRTRVLMDGLHFANGVAVGPDDAYVLVCETAEYRIHRYWLKGDRAGTSEIFIDNLPGFPDNLSYNDRDRFWVALSGAREAKLDELMSGSSFLRHVIARVPGFLQPRPSKHSFVLGLGLDGTVIANLQYAGNAAYAPITSVREHGPWLYFGSLTETAIGRLPLNQAVEGAPPPPMGWDQGTEARQIPKPLTRREAMNKQLQEQGPAPVDD